MEEDEEYKYSPNELYYPDADLDEARIDTRRISESQEETECFINNQKRGKKRTTEINTHSPALHENFWHEYKCRKITCIRS